MKGIFKLIPAALAVFALASCSTDVLESNVSQEQTVASKGDLRITFDPFDDATRALRDNNFGKLTFQEGDQVNVYSEDLYKTDWYQFQTDAFYYASTGERMVEDPRYGVMPGDKVKKAYINRKDRTTCVDIEIPEIITYGAESEVNVAAEGDPVDLRYACNLPAFGYASLNDAGYVEVSNLRYMVGILKIDLTKAVSNASWLRLINYGQDGDATAPYSPVDNFVGVIGSKAKALSGILTAVLPSNEADRKNVALAATDETLATKPYLYVDLRTVISNTSCIYIPVVPGLDGDIDKIRLEYSAKRVDDPNEILSTEWVNVPGMSFPGTEFKQHSRYKGKYAFEFKDMNPKLVSDMLDQYKATNGDIDINVTKTFTINSADATIDNVIYVPAFDDDNIDVNITLDPAFTTWDRVSGSKTLTIKDADPENPFKGTITINAADQIKGVANYFASMIIDLKEGKAIVAGEFTNTQRLQFKAGEIQIGDGTTPTKGFIQYGALGDDVLSFTVAQNAEWTDDIECSNAENKTATITVNGTLNGDITGGKVTSAISVGETGVLAGFIDASLYAPEEAAPCTITVAGDMTGDIYGSPAEDKTTKCTITISGDVTGDVNAAAGGLFTDVNLSGIVDGDINMPASVKGMLHITSGDAADPDATFVTGDVTTQGDVWIALSAEGEAIAGTLTMTGAAKTLKLVQGYVNEIEVNVSDAGSWEEMYINVNLNGKKNAFKSKADAADETEGLAAFATLTETKGIAKFTESVWDGEFIANATYANTYTDASAASQGTTKAIFTASQLARTLDATGVGALCNNIDLNTKLWLGVKINNNFSGFKVVDQSEEEDEYPTIKNLKIGVGYNGLFTEIASAATIKNITIDGVTSDLSLLANYSNIGAIAGTVSAAATFENIEVKNFAVASANPLSNVGGFVGEATATIDATNCTVAGSIDGYKCLGGFVGTTNKATSFTNCDASAITFKQSYTSSKAMDIDYAKIGGFIGNVSKTVAVTITGKAPESINYDKSSKMYVSDTSAGTGNFFTYEPRQTFIGFSGNDNDKVETDVIATSTINGASYCADADFGTSKALENNGHYHGLTWVTFLYTWPAK